MLSEEIIHDLIEGLQLIFEKNITQIILYVSVARQEESAESDIDIAVVVETFCRHSGDGNHARSCTCTDGSRPTIRYPQSCKVLKRLYLQGIKARVSLP